MPIYTRLPATWLTIHDVPYDAVIGWVHRPITPDEIDYVLDMIDSNPEAEPLLNAICQQTEQTVEQIVQQSSIVTDNIVGTITLDQVPEIHRYTYMALSMHSPVLRISAELMAYLQLSLPEIATQYVDDDDQDWGWLQV